MRMIYDLNIEDPDFAREFMVKSGIVSVDIDSNVEPPLYQFFGLSKYDLSRTKSLLYGNSGLFELRDGDNQSESYGRIVWPPIYDRGLGIEEVLDLY
jgi:hypothetical protein